MIEKRKTDAFGELKEKETKTDTNKKIKRRIWERTFFISYSMLRWKVRRRKN